MNRKRIGIRGLEFRDYFWLHHGPAKGDEKPWRRLECAGIRIAESAAFLSAERPYDQRLWAAKRIRRAANESAKLLPQLAYVDAWTLEAADFFREIADAILVELAALS